jgi:cytochrome c oxidase subunit I+III
MSEPRFLHDVSPLPDHAFDTRSATWWGVMGFVLIEAVGFALAFAAYFFLMAQEKQWPASAFPPDLLWGSVTLVILLVSEIPNLMVERAARRYDQQGVQRWLIVVALFAVAALVSRALEFDHLNVPWDRSAYASILWALLVLHTFHLITDFCDTLVLTALMHTGKGDRGRRYVDTSENALYWHFIVGSWVLVYLVMYWVPRLT